MAELGIPLIVTLFIRIPILGDCGNSADPVQMPHNAASAQGIHCFLIEFLLENTCKNQPMKPLETRNGLNRIIIDQSTGHKRVKEGE